MAAASAWLPLLFETLVVVLTTIRTLGSVRHKSAGMIARVLLQDGILYYRYSSEFFCDQPLVDDEVVLVLFSRQTRLGL